MAHRCTICRQETTNLFYNDKIVRHVINSRVSKSFRLIYAMTAAACKKQQLLRTCATDYYIAHKNWYPMFSSRLKLRCFSQLKCIQTQNWSDVHLVSANLAIDNIHWPSWTVKIFQRNFTIWKGKRYVQQLFVQISTLGLHGSSPRGQR